MPYTTTARTVNDLMTPSPAFVTPELPLQDLGDLFAILDYDAFPVVNDLGRLEGVVHRLDLFDFLRANRIQARAGLPAERVRDVMCQDVPYLLRETSLSHASEVMASSGRGTLPVVERAPANGSGAPLAGVVTCRDIFDALRVGGDRNGNGNGNGRSNGNGKTASNQR